MWISWGCIASGRAGQRWLLKMMASHGIWDSSMFVGIAAPPRTMAIFTSIDNWNCTSKSENAEEP